MEVDTFLSAQRWKILEMIARAPSSPIEIAAELKTSVAYISQQLKLLEAAGLVVKTKTGNADKGKPRNLFSLSNEIAHIAVLAEKFPSKKMIYLSGYHKTILRIWLLETTEVQYTLEKLYWYLESDLKEIQAIAVASQPRNSIIVLSESKKIKQKLDTFFSSVDKKVDYKLLTLSEFKRVAKESLTPIYDPNSLIVENNLKGGENQSGN